MFEMFSGFAFLSHRGRMITALFHHRPQFSLAVRELPFETTLRAIDGMPVQVARCAYVDRAAKRQRTERRLVGTYERLYRDSPGRIATEAGRYTEWPSVFSPPWCWLN